MVDLGLHGAERRADLAGDLLVGEAVDVAQQQRLDELRVVLSMVSIASSRSSRVPAMTLVVRGSGRSIAACSVGSWGVACLFIRRYVERALFMATTCSQVVNRPRPFHDPILAATLISASWQASSASGRWGSTLDRR